MYPPGAAYFYALDTANGDSTLSWFLLASYFFVVLAIMGVTYATVACLTRGRGYSYTELGNEDGIYFLECENNREDFEMAHTYQIP